MAPQRGPKKPVKIKINRTIPDTFIIAAYRSWRFAARLHIRLIRITRKLFLSGPFFLQAQVSESLGQSSQNLCPAPNRGALSRRRAAPPTLSKVRLFPDPPTNSMPEKKQWGSPRITALGNYDDRAGFIAYVTAPAIFMQWDLAMASELIKIMLRLSITRLVKNSGLFEPWTLARYNQIAWTGQAITLDGSSNVYVTGESNFPQIDFDSFTIKYVQEPARPAPTPRVRPCPKPSAHSAPQALSLSLSHTQPTGCGCGTAVKSSN